MRAVVTTGREGALFHELEARELCTRFGLDFTARAGRKLETVVADSGAEVVAVFGEGGLILCRHAVKLRFSAGLAELRIKRVAAGEHEPLAAVGGFRAGEVVLDATLGLARDALVMAAAGVRVEGLESQPLLAAFVDSGLRCLDGAAGKVAARVSVRLADASIELPGLAARSVDVVYFDPMFTEFMTMPPEYELFRALANPAPFTNEMLAHARRVARRCVLVKDGPRGNRLKALGVPLRELTFGRRVRYARIDPL